LNSNDNDYLQRDKIITKDSSRWIFIADSLQITLLPPINISLSLPSFYRFVCVAHLTS